MATTVASSPAPIRVTNPVSASYDQGMDIQPNASWSKAPPQPPQPPQPLQPQQPMATTTTTLTSSNTVVTANSPANAAVALEKNLNPVDKEDPLLRTKVLPFAASSPSDVAATVVTPSVQSLPNTATHPASVDYYAEHNGNILDRTMDQIRSWVHSFKQNAQDEYEEYVEEEGDAQHEPSTIDNVKSALTGVQQQAASTLQNVSAAASQQAQQVSSTVRQQAEVVQARVGDVAHAVGDRAAATVGQVKATVNDFIAAHQSNSGEPLTTTISNSISAQLPSQAAVKQQVSAIIPPLAQQASSSYAFLGSFGQQYLSTYRTFLLALRRQSLPLQMMTAMLVITHAILPLFFFDKAPARSVLYCFCLSSLLSQLTFFLSGHLRYMFLAHLVFLPMLVSLTLHAGFGEAADVERLTERYQEGENFRAALIAPLSLRSYLFVLWLRVVLMVQASLLTLDAVNVLDMLGFSLETRRGQEMQLINRSVAQMRRQFAHNIAPPQAGGQQATAKPAGMRRRHSRSNTSAAASSGSAQPASRQSASSLHPQSAASGSSQSSAQWLKKAPEEDSSSEERLIVQSHEQQQPTASTGLRERKVNPQPQQQQDVTAAVAAASSLPALPAAPVHPTFYVNNERV